MISDTDFDLFANLIARCQEAVQLQTNPSANCFERALHMLIAIRTLPKQTPMDGRWRLAHGVVISEMTRIGGTRYVYAWLENGPVVFDTAVGRLYYKKTYYSQGHVTTTMVKRYSALTVQGALKKNGGVGPWVFHLKVSKKNRLQLVDIGQPKILNLLPGLSVGRPPEHQNG